MCYYEKPAIANELLFNINIVISVESIDDNL